MHHAGRYAVLGLAMTALLLTAAPAAAQDGLRQLSQAEISVLLHDVQVDIPGDIVVPGSRFYADGHYTPLGRVIRRIPFTVFDGGICIDGYRCQSISKDASGQIWFGPFWDPTNDVQPYRVRIIPIER